MEYEEAGRAFSEIAEIIIDMSVKLNPSLVNVGSVSLNKLGKLTAT